MVCVHFSYAIVNQEKKEAKNENSVNIIIGNERKEVILENENNEIKNKNRKDHCIKYMKMNNIINYRKQ